jgi:hypothetical protein
MTFSGEDPVAIHSVISAGHRIIRDICENRGDIESYLRFTDWIKPGYEKQFWNAINASANFIKHADNDEDAIHELDEGSTDFMILLAAKWYGDLGFARSPEMRSFAFWWILQNPSTVTAEYYAEIKKAGYASQFETLQRQMPHFNRVDRLKAGQVLLKNAR